MKIKRLQIPFQLGHLKLLAMSNQPTLHKILKGCSDLGKPEIKIAVAAWLTDIKATI